MKRRVYGLLAAAVFAAALWHGGQGLYIHAKAALAQVLIRGAWAKTQTDGTPVKPWSWADTAPVARLIAPGHGIDVIVLAGGSGRTLAFGPGHVTGTALPGEPGRSLIGGHRDTHFRFLRDLRVGNALVVERRDGRRLRFSVIDARVVDERHHGLVLEQDEPLLTLVTCYPFDNWQPGGPLRYVVTAAPQPAPG
jgi:sortase A